MLGLIVLLLLTQQVATSSCCPYSCCLNTRNTINNESCLNASIQSAPVCIHELYLEPPWLRLACAPAGTALRGRQSSTAVRVARTHDSIGMKANNNNANYSQVIPVLQRTSTLTCRLERPCSSTNAMNLSSGIGSCSPSTCFKTKCHASQGLVVAPLP
jgi:hypothetical protein